MAQAVEEWYKQMPVITRSYLTAAVLTNIGCSLDKALFYVAVLAGLLHRFPANFTQQTASHIRNRKSGGSAGAKASEQGEAITFADVAGVDEAKAELEEIVEFLRNPDTYIRLRARSPRGVLLLGYQRLINQGFF